jgi:hypothetical protein
MESVWNEGGRAARSLCRHVHALRCGGMRVTIGGKCLRLDAVVSTRQQLDVLHATKSIDISDELFSCQTSTATLKEPLGPGTSRTVNDSNNLQSNESIDPGTLARRCDCLSAATPGRRSKWFFTEQIVALRTLFHLSTLSSEAYSWILRVCYLDNKGTHTVKHPATHNSQYSGVVSLHASGCTNE